MSRALLLGMLLGSHSEAASAQASVWATSCPPPLKLAAGACVRSCPAGYDDRGRECAFRSLGR
ncbi:hypothetical protein F6X51_25495 [Methylobacterium planeticum]|uniref:Secreted protein n=1 Tax=Methylobacterium planeticum TaxID=2615211 RepID=A0A6N6MEY7_9HYPH|nr:hypothetical protein F6X51_25495 [Methylobacterium planeticum]